MSSFLGSSLSAAYSPTPPSLTVPANLSASTESMEPAHGAREVVHCVSAGQDPSARRCAYLDRPSAASGGSRRTVCRDTLMEDRMTTTEPPTRRLRRREEPTPAQAL